MSNSTPVARLSNDTTTPRPTTTQYALLIYETSEACAGRKDPNENEPNLAAWRIYHRSLVEAGVYVAGDPLHVPEMGTTVRVKNGKRGIQDGPYAETKEQLGGFIILELPSLDTNACARTASPLSSCSPVTSTNRISRIRSLTSA